MDNVQCLTILANLEQYKHDTYSNLNTAMLNKQITDDHSRQLAITEFEAAVKHLQSNGYKLTDEVNNVTIYLNRERYETKPVFDIHGVITDGTSRALVKFEEYGRILSDLKVLESMPPSPIRDERLFELQLRKATIDANTRYSIRWTEATSETAEVPNSNAVSTTVAEF